MTYKIDSLVPLSWIQEDDFVILQWLAERDIVTTPKVLAFELDIQYPQLKKRLGVLRDHNLIEHPPPGQVPDGVKATGVYQITDLGKEIAAGQLTIQEMREMEQEGVFD